MSKTAEEILDYVYKRVQGLEEDMSEFGFDESDMDEWTQGNYDAYQHLLAWILETKE
jgi:hypothetical protein